MSHVQQGNHAQNFSLQVFLYKCFHFMFHTCNLVHLLSMELVRCKLFNMPTIFKFYYGMFKYSERMHSYEKGTWFVV